MVFRGERFTKNQYIGGNCLKSGGGGGGEGGGWTVCRFKRGLAERRGEGFEGRG